MFNGCSTTHHVKKIKPFLHKELVVNVATICEETLGDNECMGSELYIMLNFDAKQVHVSELEIDSCENETINEIGIYPWKLTQNKSIEIEILPKKLPFSGIEILSLKLKDKKVIGKIKRLNGKVKEYVFEERTIKR